MNRLREWQYELSIREFKNVITGGDVHQQKTMEDVHINQ